MLQALAITRLYPGSAKPAVNAVDLTIAAGEFVSIIGRSGSGKSTLLHMLSSLVRPDSGSILFEGNNICTCSENERNKLRRKEFAVVFQQHHLMPYLTAVENILLPFMHGMTPVSDSQYEEALCMLERVGLSGKEKSLPGNLSGGEQQRVAIARALARGAKILFADEPTGSLDSATGLSIMELLHSLNKDGVSIIMVTHNPDYAQQAHRAVTMADGRIVD